MHRASFGYEDRGRLGGGRTVLILYENKLIQENMMVAVSGSRRYGYDGGFTFYQRKQRGFLVNIARTIHRFPWRGVADYCVAGAG
jgi:hypothetical protein